MDKFFEFLVIMFAYQIQHKGYTMQSKFTFSLLCVGLAVGSLLAVDNNETKTYELGAVEITAVSAVDANPTVTTIKAKDIKDVGAKSVGEAIRRSAGVYFQDPTSQGDTREIHIRGFNSGRHGLFLDGIPVMNVYDRVTDYNQFSTQGVSSIQISKGFTSPAYGASIMGGGN